MIRQKTDYGTLEEFLYIEKSALFFEGPQAKA